MSEEIKEEEAKVTEENAVNETAESTETDAPAEEVPADDASKMQTLEAKIAELEKANAELKEQFLRKAADFENFRKRSIQERQDAFDYANTNLLKDLLDSLDNFDRTIEAAATATDPKTIAEGVSMINKSMINMLESKYNLKAYGEAGDAFDPDLHEAIGSVQEDVQEQTLKAVYLKGYKLKDRVIRHAKVMVSMPKSE